MEAVPVSPNTVLIVDPRNSFGEKEITMPYTLILVKGLINGCLVPRSILSFPVRSTLSSDHAAQQTVGALAVHARSISRDASNVFSEILDALHRHSLLDTFKYYVFN